MAKNSGYIVPKAEQHEFDLMIQRANRRIKRTFEFIQQEDIKSDATIRALVGDYGSKSSWAGEKVVFSRSKKFASQKDYERFRRHVEQWGGDDYSRSAENVKQGYYKSIIRALTTVAIDNGAGEILTKNGRLPSNLAKKIKGLSLEQMSNFFDHADPTDEIERNSFRSDEFIGVDRTEYVDIVTGYINRLEELFPSNSTISQAPKPKAKRKKAKVGVSKRIYT